MARHCVRQWAGLGEVVGRQWAGPMVRGVLPCGRYVRLEDRPMGTRVVRVWWAEEG